MNGEMAIEGGVQSFCTLWCRYMLRKTAEGTATYATQLVKYCFVKYFIYCKIYCFSKRHLIVNGRFNYSVIYSTKMDI